MMRIAYVSADPGVPVFGRKGCSVHAQGVLRALERRGARIDLFAEKLGGNPPPDLEHIPIHELPAPRGTLADRERDSLEANSVLAAALEHEGPFDVVYERYSLWSFAGMENATRALRILEVNAPLIDEQALHRRGFVDRDGAANVARRAFAAATILVAVSDEVAGYLEGFPQARGRIAMIPNGVDPTRFDPSVAPSRPGPPGSFTVGFLGTLKPWHGCGVLVEAFARMQDRGARLLVVGDGPEGKRLVEDLSRRRLLGSAEVTGAVDPEEVPGLLASMNAGVAPYPEAEGFYFSPLKVYEYMAAGLPVVASRVGQLAGLVRHGVDGLLCGPGDPAGLAAALRRLRADEALARRLGRAGRARVLCGHTWDRVVDRIFEAAAGGAAMEAG